MVHCTNQNRIDFMKTISKMVLGSSLVAALLPLMCCFLPALLSVGAGLGFLGGSFEWVHPAQPFLTTFSVGALGFAHFKNFKSSKKCSGGESCQNDKSKRTINTWFMWTFTLLILALMILNYWYEL